MRGTIARNKHLQLENCIKSRTTFVHS